METISIYGDNRFPTYDKTRVACRGIVVQVGQLYVTIHEYYEDWLFVTHYFACQIIGETERFLTTRERKVGLEPRWLSLEEAVTLFSKHQEYAYEEMKRGSYLRDYKALDAYCRIL